MLLKDFIALLQQKYDSVVENSEYYETMGEPEIFIDVFTDAGGHRYTYAGYDPKIRVDMDPANGNFIISSFGITT
jgi:hypothetical protein